MQSIIEQDPDQNHIESINAQYASEDIDLLESVNLQIDISILLNCEKSIDEPSRNIKREHGNSISKRLSFKEIKESLLYTKYKLRSTKPIISSQMFQRSVQIFHYISKSEEL